MRQFLVFSLWMFGCLTVTAMALDPGNQRILNDIQKTLAENPDSVIAHRDYQIVMEPEIGSAQLEAEYNQRLRDKGETPENLYLMSRFKRGEEFRQASDNLIARYPNSPLGLWIAARFQRRSGNLEQAITLYQEALKLRHPDISPHIFRTWASAVRITNGPDAAIAILDQALASYPGHLDTMAQKSYMLLLAGQTEAALKLTNDVLISRLHHEQALRTEGLAYLELERFHEATISFETFLRLWPSRTDVWIYLSNAVTVVNGPEAGEIVLEEGLERNPRDPDLAARIAHYYNMLDEYVKALEMANLALVQDLSHPGGLSEGAHALYFLGRYDEAEDKFLDILNSNPRSPDVWIMLSEVIRERDGIDAGLQVLGKALQNNQDNQNIIERQIYFQNLKGL